MHVKLMKSNLPWTIYEFKIIRNLNVLFNFTFLTSPWPVTSRSSSVVCERIKLNRTDVISLIMHALKDIAEKVSKKKQPPKQSNVGFLSRQKMSQLFPLDKFGRIWGQKLTGRTWAHWTETEIRTKAQRLLFSFSFISVMSPFVLTTPGHPSHYLFAYFHQSLPLGRIQHHTRQQCLPLCVIFSTTRDGRVCLWVTLIVMVQYDSVCISVPSSPSHKMAVFASFSHAEHHTRW